MDIVLITSNQAKLDEARRILAMPVQNMPLELDELQELDPIKISDHKVMQAWSQIHKPCVVWDTSVYIHCLNDFPGPLIKWFWKAVGAKKICEIADMTGDRKIYNETILTLYDGNEIKHFRGRYDGEISNEPRGKNGWDWDTIFMPKGHNKTYAEMQPDEMIRYRSHGIALEKLRAYLLKI